MLLRILLYITLLFLSLGTSWSQSSNINKLEYFFNTDPGVGQGANIPVTPGTSVSTSLSIPTTGLAAGFHRLYLRARYDNGRWGMAEARAFYLYQPPLVSTPDIDKLEYFFNTDPGVGNGTPIPINAGTSVSTALVIPTNSLGTGFHRLYVRARYVDGRWGLVEGRTFYLYQPPLVSTPNIDKLEYFFNTDPGVGNGTPIPINAGTSVSTALVIPTTGLATGFHRLYVRARYVDGRWGLVEGRTFYLYQPPLASTPNIDKLEYFFNTDPGVGNGTAIPINTGASVSTAIALPTTSLATGFHRLYVRARYVDGRWGLVETRSFYLYPTSTFPQNIVAAEVFFDTDPGVGQGTAISLGAAAPSIATNIQVTVPNLALGTHFLYLRAKFANGSWSLVERDTFTVLQVMYDAALSNLMHPNGGCGVTANSSIQVTLANNTNVALPVSAATLNLTVSGANTGSYTMVNPSSVPAFGSIVITFTGINLSNAGLNNLVATVTAPSDPNSANNTANATVTGVPGQTYYLDGDGDGFGNPAISTLACSQPAGYVVNNSDCNDANAAVHPNTVWYLDADNDGYYTGSGVTQCLSPGSGYHFSGLTAGGDCNDAVAAIHPGATENCDNSIDDNCNGQIDEGARFYFYADADGDGFGNSAVSLFTCVLPSGYVSDNTDCNDSNPTIHPGGSEICNNLDDDCDNSIDEGVQTNFYADIDGDGYGNPAVSTLACTAPAGYVSNNQDCNDDAAAIHPGQVENCNGLDDNCNGQVDEGVKSTFYADADGDGFGNLNVSLLACTAPAGYVADHTDCNDANAALHPGVPEICDAFDNNCDGQVNEGFTAVTYYRDLDQDGFGDPSNPQTNCAQPGGYVTNNLDCNDSNPAVNPSATELCGNTVDENCDGTVFYVCNDACADAQVLEVSSSGTCTTPVSGKVYDAGSEIASENLCGDVLSDPADSWYYFVATATAHRIHLAKTAPGTGGRIYFQLFQGSTCTALTYLEPSDCNYGSADVAGLLYTGFTPGIRYYVRVISQHSAVPNNDDDFTLCVTTPVLPTNETCAQATALTIPAGCSNTAPGLSFDLANANASAVSSCLPTAPDLWYTFQAVHDTYLVEFPSLSGGTLPGGQLAVELFSGACDQPVSISCALNQPAIFANLTIGQTYFIRLADSAYPAYSGSFRLQPQHTFLISPGAEANICSGQSITLSASGGTSYSWSNNQTGPSITVHPTENTQYWVLINKNSCAEQRTIQVMVTPPSYIYPDKPVVYVCENNSIQLEARQATTAGWSTGQTSLNIIFTPTMDSTLLFLEASSGQCIFYDTVKVKLSHGYPDKPKNLLPDSLSGVQDEDLYLEWSPVPGAKSYDVYFWPAGTTKPDQPLFINSKLNRVFLSIPNPTYNSTYFWQVSALNEACETYSDIQKFVLRNLPDLEVSNIQLPDHLISGEDITISYTVRNNGPGYTGFNKQWFDLIYFSDDTTLQTMVDPKLGNVGNLSALYPGETYTRSATFHIPIDPVFSGVFHVIIDAAWRLKNTNLVKFPQVNYGNDIKPSIETVTVVLPDESDLQVVAGNCPLNFFSNSKIPLSWAVQNKGLGRTNKPHWNDVVRLVQDTVTMAGAITIGTAARDTVLFKDSTYYRHILSNKIPPEISGPYYVVIAADDNNDVWEHVLETNNRRVIPVNVVLAAAPDLVPRVLQLPDTIKYGIPFFGKLGVLNQGLVPCDGPVSHKMTLQKVQPQQGDQIVTHYFAQDQWLNAGDSLQSSGYFTVDMAPSSSPLPGAYRPTVQVDASDAVFEYTGENNNERSYQKQVVLVAPDLVITSISTNLTNIIAGDLLKVSYEVLNQGPDFLQKTWADSIYVTNNNSPFGPKVLVREVTNQQLKTFFHNERRTYTLDIALPCNFTEGAYYVWAKADIYGEVVESNDQNNRSTAFAFQVQTGDCQADLAVSHLVVSDSIGYCTEYTVAYTIKNVYYKPVVYGGNCDALAGIFPNHDLIELYAAGGASFLLNQYNHCGPTKLFPGDTLRITTAFRIETDNPIHPGLYSLKVKVNAGAAGLQEIDFINNTISKSIYVDSLRKPDLVIKADPLANAVISGQPFQLVLHNTNQGVGPTIGHKSWVNSVDLSVEPHNLSNIDDLSECKTSYFCDLIAGGFCNCSLLSAYEVHSLDAQGSSTDTLTLTLPASTPTGLYYLVLTTDIKDNICEFEFEGNNQSTIAISVNRPDPADLIVTDIQHPDSVDVGIPFDIKWTLKNQGNFAAEGSMREAVYLSKDTHWSEEDLLMGYRDANINLGKGMAAPRSIKAKVTKAALESYYVIVRTDLLDNIWETNNLNNQAGSGHEMAIRIPFLPIGQEITATLPDGKPLFYVIDTKPEHLDETILVQLTSPDSVQATNQLYIRRGILPSLEDFDYRSLRSGFGNQEAAIPAVENVRYYLRVDGFKGIGQDSQLVKLKASILPFQIRSVQSAKGGNTGYATVLLKGGKFSPQMQIFLQRDTLLIPADSLGFVDGTKAFARFNLLNQPLGLYTVRGLHPLGDTASWHYYEIEPGGPPDVVTFLRHPVSVTTRRRGPTTGVVPQLMTLDFENRGNTDIPIPYQPVRSVGGAPLSFSSGDLIGSQATELQVPLLELEGPQAYLRAGAKGSMVIWVNWAGKPMFFAVEKIK